MADDAAPGAVAGVVLAPAQGTASGGASAGVVKSDAPPAKPMSELDKMKAWVRKEIAMAYQGHSEETRMVVNK